MKKVIFWIGEIVLFSALLLIVPLFIFHHVALALRLMTEFMEIAAFKLVRIYALQLIKLEQKWIKKYG